MPNDKRRLAINIGKRAAVGVSLTIIPGTKSWTHGVPFSRDAIRATLAASQIIAAGDCRSMARKMSATAHLNQGLRLFFSEFVRVSLRHPSQALFFARTVLWQGRAARRRAAEAREGVDGPSHRHLQHHQQVQSALQGLLRPGHPRRDPGGAVSGSAPRHRVAG